MTIVLNIIPCIKNAFSNMKIVSATAGVIFLPQLVQQKNQNLAKPNAQEMGFLDPYFFR